MTRGEELARVGTTALKTIGDRELPDTTLPAAKREVLKQTARDIAEESDEHELMFLASALEVEALRRRGL